MKDFVDEKDRGQNLLTDNAYFGKGVKKVMRKLLMKDKVIKRNTLTNLVHNPNSYEQVLRLGIDQS